MKSLIYFFLIIFAASAVSCTSGKKSYVQGDYYQSVMQAVERLRKSPGHKKTKSTLSAAYPQAVQYYTDRANRYRNSSEPFKYGIVYDSYKMLNNLYEQIQRSPGALEVIPAPVSYLSELTRYQGEAAAEQYYAGEEALKTETREGAKIAFGHFHKADAYVPGYLDVHRKMEEAKMMAMLRVQVDQVPVPTWQYQVSVDFFQDQVEQFLFNYRENEFVQFFSTNDQSLDNPDQILVVQFDDFVVGMTNQFETTETLEKDSVVVGQVERRDGTKQNVYGTVKAKYTEQRREIISRGMVSMRIIDAYSNTVVLHEKFPGEFVWTSIWAGFNGDERALTKEQLRRTTLRPLPPPPPQDLFVEFCRPIYAQLQSAVRRYYHAI
jgi:hypothetical protein